MASEAIQKGNPKLRRYDRSTQMSQPILIHQNLENPQHHHQEEQGTSEEDVRRAGEEVRQGT